MIGRPRLTVLSEEGIQLIHDMSMQILGTVGVRIPHPEMRRLFGEAGAQVDDAAEIVKIPERLVMQCLGTVGKSFTLYGRDRSKQARFGFGERNYVSTAGQALWVDDTSTQRRYTTLDDVVTGTRLGDGLPLLNVVGAMADPHELPVQYRCVVVAATVIKNSTKPLQLWFYDRASARFLMELFVAVAGSEEEVTRYPITFPFLEPISPLRFPREGIDLIFEAARLSLPVPVGPMAQVGSSAPGTLAGTMAQENAEILAGLCVVQLIQPGLAAFYSGIPHAFDMRTTQLIFSGPEQALMSIAMTQMGNHYGLPVGLNVGTVDSKFPDAQAGMEAGINLACGFMAGADLSGALGICGVDQGTSPAILVMQHEAMAYVERIMRGFELSDETFALDVIRSVGPGGTFLAEPHTVRHFRQELWFPQLLDREYWSNWVEQGAAKMHDRCIAMKDKILREHTPEPLDEDTAREVDKIVDAARRHLVEA